MRRLGLALAAVCTLAVCVTGSAQTSGTLISVDVADKSGALEVSLSGDRPLQWTSLRLASPPRFVVDLAGTRNAVRPLSRAVGGPVVTQIRVSQFRVVPSPATRIVFDLAGPHQPPDITAEGNRLRLVFSKGTAASPATKAVLAKAPAMVSANAAPAEPAPAPPAPPKYEPRIRHLLYELSYTQADRALAVLKALGYATVEFSTAAGDSPYDQQYNPIGIHAEKFPTVIKLIDSPKTSLMDRDPAAQPLTPQQAALQAAQLGGTRRQAVPDIGGTYLHQATTGEPQERLLIVYDELDPEPMERLVATLQDDLDVPARQVVISALVLEINVDKTRELGLELGASNGRSSVAFDRSDAGVQNPFTWIFDKAAAKTPFVFSAKLQALIEHGDAEVLSNPSVLVIDGRQARIQVGQQVPVVNSTATAAGITSSVEYFPVGIVLNLRPRINEQGSEVTMQVETIVSAVAQSSATASSVLYAPTVDNRQVQTFVRVADNTPFIIGGLIASNVKKDSSGIPGVSRIPVLGSILGRHSSSSARREVVVVLTPHVVPLEDRSFSYVIPKDSDRFDSFGKTLFRNAYRIRSTDIYDLAFVNESEVLKNLVRKLEQRAVNDPSLRHVEPYASLLRGRIPGEEILVRRMLWEIVKRSGFARSIDPKRILVFQPSGGDPQSTDFETSFLDSALAQLGPGRNAMRISFDAASRGTLEHPFVQPKADIAYENVTAADYENRLIAANARGADGRPARWSILLSDSYSGSTNTLDMLRNVLVLKRVLALNSSLPLTIADFKVGRQIIFPTEDDIAGSVHVVDRDAARLFYECKEYYRAFEQEFNATTRTIMTQWK